MRRYLSTYTYGPLWSAPTRSPVLAERFDRGSAPAIELRFVTDGVVVDPVATVTLSFKSLLTSGTMLIPAVVAVKTGTGTSTVYTLTPSFISTALDTLLGTADSAAAYGEIQTVIGANTYETPFACRIRKNVNQGGETMPGVVITGGRVYLSSITGLIGGTATDLDAITTVGANSGTIFEVVTSGALSMWKLQAGTATSDTDAGVIRPLDYHATTNAVNLVRVIGL